MIFLCLAMLELLFIHFLFVNVFCLQVTDEVKAVLEFIDYAYKIFGFTYELKLSTVYHI